MREVIHANAPPQSLIAFPFSLDNRCFDTLIATGRSFQYLYLRHRMVDYAVQP